MSVLLCGFFLFLIATLLPLALRAGESEDGDAFSLCAEGNLGCLWLVVTDSTETSWESFSGFKAPRQCDTETQTGSAWCQNCEEKPGLTCEMVRKHITNNKLDSAIARRINYQKYIKALP